VSLQPASTAQLWALPLLERCSRLRGAAPTANALRPGYVSGDVPRRAGAHGTGSLPWLEHLALQLRPPLISNFQASQPRARCPVCCAQVSVSVGMGTPGAARWVSRWAPVLLDGWTCQLVWGARPFRAWVRVLRSRLPYEQRGAPRLGCCHEAPEASYLLAAPCFPSEAPAPSVAVAVDKLRPRGPCTVRGPLSRPSLSSGTVAPRLRCYRQRVRREAVLLAELPSASAGVGLGFCSSLVRESRTSPPRPRPGLCRAFRDGQPERVGTDREQERAEALQRNSESGVKCQCCHSLPVGC